MTCPTISIVMPTRNHGQYISQAIDSLLMQTYKDFKLIVINDCSTDNTAKILKKYWKLDNRIEILTNYYNQKIGSSLNIGFAYADSILPSDRYETWNASDNYMYPHYLETLKNFLDENPHIDHIYSNCDIVYMGLDGTKEAVKRDIQTLVGNQNWDYEVFANNYNLGICWMWRRLIRIKAGTFFQYEPCEDYDMVFRFYEAGGQFAFLNENLGCQRYHNQRETAYINQTGQRYYWMAQEKARIRQQKERQK